MAGKNATSAPAAAAEATYQAPAPTVTEQDEIDRKRKIADLDEEIRLVELETKRIQLDQAKRSNQDHVITEAQRKRLAEQAQRNLRIEATNDLARKNACSHMTGGFGLEDIYDGDGKPALISTDLPIAGTRLIICSRCLGTWRTPDINLKVSDPKRYALELEEWRDILKIERKSMAKPMGCPQFDFKTEEGLPAMPEIV